MLWNEAFLVGGPSCTVAAGRVGLQPIYIDDYLTIDFGGFKDMVDAIGGVNVCIPQPLDDPTYTHTHFDAGTRCTSTGPSRSPTCGCATC